MARAPAALAEGVSESLSAEESQMLADDRAGEHIASEPVESADPAPAASETPALQDAAPEAQDAPAELSPDQKKANADIQERERRKVAEKELRQTREQMATLQGRLDVLAQMAQQHPAAQQAQAEQPRAIEIPDVNVDPIGHFQAKSQYLEETVAKLTQYVDQQQQQSQVQNNTQRLMQIAADHERSFMQERPEYKDAANFLRESRDRELQLMGYGDPGQRQAIIQNDVVGIAAQALQNNRNFAEVAMQMAEARGFRHQAAAAPAPMAATPQIPAPATPQAPSAEQRLQQVARGQETTQSLGQAAGSGSAAPLSAERLARMSDAEFEAAIKGKDWRDIMENLPRS